MELPGRQTMALAIRTSPFIGVERRSVSLSRPFRNDFLPSVRARWENSCPYDIVVQNFGAYRRSDRLFLALRTSPRVFSSTAKLRGAGVSEVSTGQLGPAPRARRFVSEPAPTFIVARAGRNRRWLTAGQQNKWSVEMAGMETICHQVPPRRAHTAAGYQLRNAPALICPRHSRRCTLLCVLPRALCEPHDEVSAWQIGITMQCIRSDAIRFCLHACSKRLSCGCTCSAFLIHPAVTAKGRCDARTVSGLFYQLSPNRTGGGASCSYSVLDAVGGVDRQPRCRL